MYSLRNALLTPTCRQDILLALILSKTPLRRELRRALRFKMQLLITMPPSIVLVCTIRRDPSIVNAFVTTGCEIIQSYALTLDVIIPPRTPPAYISQRTGSAGLLRLARSERLGRFENVAEEGTQGRE